MNTHRHPHTVAQRDAERARLAAYFTAREAAALPNECPACGAAPAEPCRPASLTRPHLARERAYGDSLRGRTPYYPTPSGGRAENVTRLRDQSGEASPVVGVVGLGVMACLLIPHAGTIVLGVAILIGVVVGVLQAMGVVVNIGRKIGR